MDTVPQTLTFSKAWEAFELAGRVEGRSRKTFAAYRYVLGSFQKWLGERELCHVDTSLLRGYITHLQERLRPASVHHHFRGLHAFLSFLHREGLLAPNPIAQIRAPKLGEYFPEVFSEEEIHRLLATPDRRTFEGFRNYAMVLAFLDTGMRLGELTGLETSDADLAGRALRVRGKGKKERLVFMGRKLTRVIYEWLKRRGHQPYSDILFCTRHGDSLKLRNVNRILERIAKRAKVTGRWNPHKFRHTFGHRYILAGGDPFSLRDLMGHSTVTVTMLYVRMAGTPHLREQHARYSPVDRLQGS
jgi:integrase/recombinase XerD